MKENIDSYKNVNVVGKKFEDLSYEEMSFIVGGDGASPMSTPVTSLTTLSLVSIVSAASSAASGLISYTATH